jgi:hypothetical protein
VSDGVVFSYSLLRKVVLGEAKRMQIHFWERLHMGLFISRVIDSVWICRRYGKVQVQAAAEEDEDAAPAKPAFPNPFANFGEMHIKSTCI